MAKLTERDIESLKADYITGKFTQQAVADKYGISKGMVNRYVKPSKSKQLIDDEVRIRGELFFLEQEKSKHLSKQELIEVNKIVEDKTKHLIMFQNSALKNQELNNMSLEAISYQIDNAKSIEEKHAIAIMSQSTLKDHTIITKGNKEIVLGKDIETQINVNAVGSIEQKTYESDYLNSIQAEIIK